MLLSINSIKAARYRAELREIAIALGRFDA